MEPAPPQNPALSTAILVAMWNYMGWDNASTVAQEVENPQRNYPRAMIFSTILVAVTYILAAGRDGAGRPLRRDLHDRRLGGCGGNGRSAVRCWGWPWLPAAPSPASACSTRW